MVMNLFASFFLNILQRQNQDYNRAVFAEISKKDFKRRKKRTSMKFTFVDRITKTRAAPAAVTNHVNPVPLKKNEKKKQ